MVKAVPHELSTTPQYAQFKEPVEPSPPARRQGMAAEIRQPGLMVTPVKKILEGRVTLNLTAL
jgi:hypothetical protein